MTNQNLKSPKTPTPPDIGPRSTRATAHYRHAGSCFLGGLATTGPLAALPGPRAGVPPQRHLANFSSTTIEQLQTHSLSRARQNFDNISRYHPSGNERLKLTKNVQGIAGEPIVLDFSLRRNFLDHGSGQSSQQLLRNETSLHLKIPSNTFPQITSGKIIVLLTAGKEGSFFIEFFIEIHNSCFQKKSSKVTWIGF